MNKDLELWEKEILNCKKINSNKNIYNKKDIKIEVKNSYDNIKENSYLYKNINENFKLTINNSLGIDSNTDKKLRTGKYKIDKVIDFHGLTINESFDLFISSINQAYENNLRCILYITGKGNNSLDKYNTIKENFKKWIKLDFVCDKIIKYTQAIQKDGGSGAFYVLLKK